MTAFHYDDELRALQIALVKTQAWAMETGAKILVVMEGRDAAGKDGAIGRIVEHLAPRNTRVVALPKPTERDLSQWYFQRYVPHLPAGGEVVIFNRSWYNRAGVERVMNFSTPAQQQQFLADAPVFERMLIEADIKLVKYWLDISKEEQAERLEARRTDPLKTLKISSLDGEAQKRWKGYSEARDEMLMRTHTAWAPWTCVRNDHKKHGRIALMRHLLNAIAPEPVRKDIPAPDPKLVFGFEPEALKDGRLAK